MRNLLKISPRIIAKLKDKHKVKPEEVFECFMNRTGRLLEDSRLNHKTDPPTMWFISETDKMRMLKIVFVALDNGQYEIKAAYEPNIQEVNIYEKYS